MGNEGGCSENPWYIVRDGFLVRCITWKSKDKFHFFPLLSLRDALFWDLRMDRLVSTESISKEFEDTGYRKLVVLGSWLKNAFPHCRYARFRLVIRCQVEHRQVHQHDAKFWSLSMPVSSGWVRPVLGFATIWGSGAPSALLHFERCLQWAYQGHWGSLHVAVNVYALL